MVSSVVGLVYFSNIVIWQFLEIVIDGYIHTSNADTVVNIMLTYLTTEEYVKRCFKLIYKRRYYEDDNLKGIARLDLFDIQEWLKNKNWRNEIMTDEHREAAELIQKFSENYGLSYSDALEEVKKMLSERATTQNSDNNLAKKPL